MTRLFMVVQGNSKSPRRNKPIPASETMTRTEASDGNFIREWRLFRGIAKQQDLADMTPGVSRSVVSRLESGSLQWSQRHIERLSVVLGCAPGDLISTDPNKMGDVFRLYERLNPAARAKAYGAIQELASPPKKKRRPKSTR